MRKTRVNAVGYYGWDNFGDELFRRAVHHSRAIIWGSDVTVRSFVLPFRPVHQNLGVLGRAARVASTVLGAIWADRVALCGGSVLEDVRGTQKVRDTLARRGQMVEALGVSLGPWSSETARERVREYAATMARIVVRDQASQDRYAGAVTVGGDLAALYPMPVIPAAEREHLTLCVSNDSGATATELADFFARMLPSVTIPVKILALNTRKGKGDLELSYAVQRRLSEVHHGVEVVKFTSVDQTIDVLAHSRAVWSQRLHGIIVAYLCDVPFLALSHHQKLSDFAQHIGLPDRFVTQVLVPSDSTRAAAEETLNSGPAWAISPGDYRARTRAAFSASIAH